MFEELNPYLVALSILVAIVGGYTGFGLAARVDGTGALNRRLLLGGAAAFLALSIWTMHFVGIMAASIPPDAAYLVLPTVLSFLICALVVGVSLFLVSLGTPSRLRVMVAALLLGAGIVSMHYVGVHGLDGDFHLVHDPAIVALAILIAVGVGYGGLRIFMARHGGRQLAFSAVAFGVAVSGMHYTAMFGMRFEPGRGFCLVAGNGLTASPQVLSLIVSLLCFLIAAGFLLLLVPDPRPGSGTAEAASAAAPVPAAADLLPGDAATPAPPPPDAPEPPPTYAERVPVEGATGTHLLDVAEIRSIRADAHYTQVHDGKRERICSWSISQAEAQLDPAVFARVHRSHIVAVPHIVMIRKEGDGGVVELDAPVPYLVPVSRARLAELRARLGLLPRGGQQNTAQ